MLVIQVKILRQHLNQKLMFLRLLQTLGSPMESLIEVTPMNLMIQFEAKPPADIFSPSSLLMKLKCAKKNRMEDVPKRTGWKHNLIFMLITC